MLICALIFPCSVNTISSQAIAVFNSVLWLEFSRSPGRTKNGEQEEEEADMLGTNLPSYHDLLRKPVKWLKACPDIFYQLEQGNVTRATASLTSKLCPGGFAPCLFISRPIFVDWKSSGNCFASAPLDARCDLSETDVRLSSGPSVNNWKISPVIRLPFVFFFFCVSVRPRLCPSSKTNSRLLRWPLPSRTSLSQQTRERAKHPACNGGS